MVWRTYECNDCRAVFEVECASADSDPDCPHCTKVLEWRPQRFAIGGSNEGKAVNYTQKIMEEDYGLTNFKDNNRAGDVGAIMPSQTTAEKESAERQAREMISQVSANHSKDFWGGNAGAAANMSSMTGQSMLATAKVGPQGPDPMAMLHKGVKSGSIPTISKMTRVVAAADHQGRRTK